jgi:hypothetical protein
MLMADSGIRLAMVSDDFNAISLLSGTSNSSPVAGDFPEKLGHPTFKSAF